MAKKPAIAKTVSTLRKHVTRLRRGGRRVALIPTMGALHDGHFALVRAARRRAKSVVVSIFVNPKQFAPTEDFSSYPRDFQRDFAALTELGVDLIWAADRAGDVPGRLFDRDCAGRPGQSRT